MNPDGAPHAGRMSLATVRRRRAELEKPVPKKSKKSKLSAGSYTDIPIVGPAAPLMTPGDSEMLVVHQDGHIESIAYNYDGVKSVAAGLRDLEKNDRHGEVVRLVCNEQVREDYKSHIKG